MPNYPELMDEFRRALLSLNWTAARDCLFRNSVAIEPVNRIEFIIVPVLEQMGREWEMGQLALSQIYMAGRICEGLVDLILPPACPQRRHQPRLAVVVLEDYHFLGKRMVNATLRASGFETYDYGRMGVEEVAARSRQDQIEVLMISTLMLPSAMRIKELTGMLKASGASTKIVVGGAPFRYDPTLGQTVGADAVGKTASDAITILRTLYRESL